LDEALSIPAVIGHVRCRYLPRAALAAGLLRLALTVLGRPDRFMALLSGAETKTLDTNRALEALASRVRDDPTLRNLFAAHEAAELWAALETQPSGRVFLAEIDAFLDRYGHRESAVLLASQPTWKDAPEVVLGIVKGLSTAPPPPPAQPVAWDDLLAHPLLRPRPLRAAFVTLLTQARLLWQIREDTHFYATMPLPVVRRTLLEYGRRLSKAGLLASADDVLHLKRSEIEGVWPSRSQPSSELRALVQLRKERRSALEGTPLHEPVLNRRQEFEDGPVVVRGLPGSPGLAEGPVRVILHDREFGKLRRGEVLVAPYTNPAWTPLFQRAAGVVVDSGSAGSHAAIVAREYSIPAVMATGDGTSRLRDGQMVQVDGTNGMVQPAHPSR
ncbi:MAG: PEP-utilizing enzyme, partial [Actinomycetota bacterium]|nr:PEP-utilizing enzyme [Actinomycetota bacterium]